MIFSRKQKSNAPLEIIQLASAPAPVLRPSDYVFVPTVVRDVGRFKKELDLGSGSRTFMIAAKATHSDGRTDRPA